jgi:hypothetical protein
MQKNKNIFDNNWNIWDTYGKTTWLIQKMCVRRSREQVNIGLNPKKN